MPPCDVSSLKRVEPLRRRFALTYDLGEQDDEGRTIHRHFVVGIDHAGMAAAWPEYLVDDMGSTISSQARTRTTTVDRRRASQVSSQWQRQQHRQGQKSRHRTI